MVQINEVSYPSHHTYPMELRRQWAAGYPLQARARVRVGVTVRVRGNGQGQTLTLTLTLTRNP